MKPATISDDQLHQLTTALSDPPFAPVKGRGNQRTLFPYVRRKNGVGLKIWNAIPSAHKYELHYGSAGRSSFQWRGIGGNIVISPIAYDTLREIGLV